MTELTYSYEGFFAVAAVCMWVVGWLMTIVSVWIIRCRRRTPAQPIRGASPGVSVLKPLSGNVIT